MLFDGSGPNGGDGNWLSRTPVAAGMATAEVEELEASTVIVTQEEQEPLALCTSSGDECYSLYSMLSQLILLE